jgi:N-acyl homoserine lactone hydrolase
MSTPITTDSPNPRSRSGTSRLAAVIARHRAFPEPAPWAGALPPAAPPAEMKLFQLPTGTYETRGAFAIKGGRFSDQRHFASTAVLVQHPKGDILIDAGFGARADQHVDLLPSFRRSAHNLGATASDQLDAAGYDRARLLGVVLTHSHWDHVSGLDSLDVPIWLTDAEQQYAEAAKDDKVFMTVSAGHEIREYTFDGPAYLGFPASHDLHGDGSVVIVPAAGHTTGSVVIFVTIPSGQRYAFIGDLTWQLEGVTRRLERPLLMRMMADSDAKQIRQDLSRIVAVAGRIQIVPAHDLRAYEGIPLLASQAAERPEQAR